MIPNIENEWNTMTVGDREKVAREAGYIGGVVPNLRWYQIRREIREDLISVWARVVLKKGVHA